MAGSRQTLARMIEVVSEDSAEVNIAKIEGAVAGDEVIVAPGTYRFRVFLDKQGTAEQPIIIRARDSRRRPVWDLEGKPVAEWPGSSRREDRGRSIWQITGSNYRINGLVFRNGTDGRVGDSGGVRFISSGPARLGDCLFQFNYRNGNMSPGASLTAAGPGRTKRGRLYRLARAAGLLTLGLIVSFYLVYIPSAPS
jgi:hypothetical protein